MNEAKMREALMKIIARHGEWNNGIWAARIASEALASQAPAKAKCDACNGSGFIFQGHGEDHQCEDCFDNEPGKAPVQDPVYQLASMYDGDLYWRDVSESLYLRAEKDNYKIRMLYTTPQPDHVAELEAKMADLKIDLEDYREADNEIKNIVSNILHWEGGTEIGVGAMLEYFEEEIAALKAQVISPDVREKVVRALRSATQIAERNGWLDGIVGFTDAIAALEVKP